MISPICRQLIMDLNIPHQPLQSLVLKLVTYEGDKIRKLEYEKRENKVDSTPADDDINVDAIVNINSANIMTMLPKDIASNLYIDIVKEIILCDYNHVEYNPKTDDDLLSSVAIVKGSHSYTLSILQALFLIWIEY
jgi:hypothetical protein